MSAMRTERAGQPRTMRLPVAVGLEVVDRRLELVGRHVEQSALRASMAAAITALPTRCVARLANVPMSCGPVSVSAVSTTISSKSTPSVSAAIWPMTVRRPWPRSVAASVTTNEPLVVAWTSACDGSPPQVGGGQRDHERAARRGMDERLRRVAAEVHAGRVVDGGHAGAAQLGHRYASRSGRRRLRRRSARRRGHRPELGRQLVPDERRPRPASSRSASRPRRACGAASCRRRGRR